jgi:transposase
MIPVPASVQVFLATGHTDMRKGFDCLALAVQEHLKMAAHGGQILVFSRQARRSVQGAVA